MKRIFVFLMLFSFTFIYASSKDPKYPVAAIPDELKKEANVVYRLDKGEFVIEKIDKASFKVHVALTILNERGDKFAGVSIHYDKLRKISSFTAFVYNKAGKEIYKLKNKDIIDESNISRISLYEDNRVRHVDLRQKEYPYTIEYTYEIQYKYLYSVPDWYVVPSEKTSVQKSEYIIKAPNHLKPRFKTVNVEESSLQESDDGAVTTYRWKFKNIKTIDPEPLSNGVLTTAPVIYASPSKFSFEGYEGDMTSWDGLAAWQNKLNEGRDILPQETIEEIRLLTKDATSRLEKIRRIYTYMQKKTRYVSIQLGIGGFQPFEASIVDKKGYGDCKALVNYTQALLKAVGIKSYYTWVQAGDYPSPVYEDFPNDYFNHIILCVPNKADTIWLECTSQTIPFAYLGKFTADRKVLVIRENGGEIVKTPSYDHNHNMIITQVNIDLDKEGDAQAKLNRLYKGIGYEYEYLDDYMTLTDNDRKKWLHKNLSIENYDVGRYKFTEQKDVIPSINLEADLHIRKLATVSGKRYFLRLNFMNGIKSPFKKDESRIAPVFLRFSSITSDTVNFSVPDNLHVEFIPKAVNIESPFGSYSMKVVEDQNKLIYYRTLRLNKGQYDAAQYNELVEFFQGVSSADSKKAVLIDKT